MVNKTDIRVGIALFLVMFLWPDHSYLDIPQQEISSDEAAQSDWHFSIGEAEQNSEQWHRVTFGAFTTFMTLDTQPGDRVLIGTIHKTNTGILFVATTFLWVFFLGLEVLRYTFLNKTRANRERLKSWVTQRREKWLHRNADQTGKPGWIKNFFRRGRE